MTDQVIDMAALKRLLEVIGGDAEDLQELIEDFEDTTPGLLEKLRSASASGDWNTLRITSHSLKSNGRDFGALQLTSLCEALEHDARDGEVQDAVGRVDQIAASLDVARDALRTIRIDEL